MIDKEKFYSWIDRRSGLFTFGGLIIGLIALVISIILAWERFGEIVSKMIAIIISIVIITISLFVVIIFAIGLIRKPLINRLNKKNEEIKQLRSKIEEEKKHSKSELEAKKKQYNDLFNKTNPRYPIDRLITTEVRYNPTGKVGIDGDHLIFGIRVINRTNYDFMPNKAFLACYYDKDPVFKAEWEERAKSSPIIPYDLHRLADGYIQFHVPKQNIEDNMRVLKLKGYVEYITEEDIIHDTQRKNVKVDITNLEYKLEEKEV